MARIPKKKKKEDSVDQQGGERPRGGGAATPKNPQQGGVSPADPSRLNDRQAAQFRKIRKSQGKEAAQAYRTTKQGVNAGRATPTATEAPSFANPSEMESVPSGEIVDNLPGLNDPEFFYPKLPQTPEDIAGSLDFLNLGSIQDLVSQLNPDIFAMGPDNYKPSAYYDEMQKTGSDALNKEYAKRGLFGSGAALQGQADLTRRLVTEDVERAKALHTEKQGNLLNALTATMGNYANTLSSMYGVKSQYDLSNPNTALKIAQFVEDVKQGKIKNNMELFTTLLGQNPLATAAGITTDGAGVDQAYVGGISQGTEGLYSRPTQTTSFGGGAPRYTPPPPGGPDYSQPEQLAIQNEINRILGNANAGLVNSGQGGVSGSGNALSQLGGAAKAVKPIWDVVSSFF